jgi:hypothetical protein
MRLVLAAIMVLVLAVGGPLNPLAWVSVIPLAASVALLALTTGSGRTAAAAFGAVAGGIIAAFHVAWQFDVGRVATGSSTAAIALVSVPFFASVAGLLAAGVAFVAQSVWQHRADRVLARWIAPAAFAVGLTVSSGVVIGQIAWSGNEWPEVGTLVTNPGLHRERVLETDLRGRIRWIGEVDGTGVMAVTGQAGFDMLDATLQPAGRVDAVADTGGPAWLGLQPVVVRDGDGFLVFQGGGGYGPVRMRRLNGAVLWDFEEATGERPSAGIVVATRPGRVLRYIVAGRSSVYGYDASFRTLWRAKGGAARISAVDRGGVLTLVAQRSTGEVVLLDERGRDTGGLAARPRFDFAHAVAWPDSVAIVAARKGRLSVLDPRGNVLHEWTLSPIGRSPVVTTVAFGLPGDPHLAVMTESSSGWGRSVLTVIDAAGVVVHHEVVDKASGLHAARRPDGDVLLFADGRRHVWSLAADPRHVARLTR